MNNYVIEDGIVYVDLARSTKTMICDQDDWEKLKCYTWSELKGYASGYKNKKTIYFSRMVMDAPKGMEVDHINRNTLDNRKKNLRIISHSGNMSNKGAYKNSKTGVAGVYWHKHRKKYFVELKTGTKRHCLGAFHTLEEAIKAREEAETKYRKPYLEKETLS